MRSSRRSADPLRKRIVKLTILLLLLFGLIASRLVWLQIIRGSSYRAAAESNHTVTAKITPERGLIQITDKFNPQPYPVATNIDKILVYADVAAVSNAQQTAEALAPILGIKAEDLAAKLTDPSKHYVPLKRDLSQEEQQKLKDLKLAGIAFDSEIARFYPEKEFLAPVLGYVGFGADGQKQGLYGLERVFNKELAGVAGELAQEKDAGGSWIFGARRDITPAQDGDSLLLTVDRNIQLKAESVLKNAVSKNSADSGCIIVADPKTGAVLAMANYPEFDPNAYSKAADPSYYNNSCTTGSYEPGSIFKGMTMAAGIDAGKITPDTTYVDTGKVEVDGYTIQNAIHVAHGQQTMTFVLEQSLNTGAIFAENKLGNADFKKYVKKFGFGQKTGIELPETAGNINNLQGNIQVQYDTAAFGQGISVTPLQMVQAYGALANGGKLMRPYIVQARITPAGKATVTQPQEVAQVITPQTASLVTGMLVDVVDIGHGKRAAVAGYDVAGKTGTAQVSNPKGRGYLEGYNIGSFVGFAPVEDPKFVMIVRVTNPRNVKYAETTAAPAFGEMAQFLVDYFKIPPTRPLPPAKK